jgi:DNA-binding transcriptional regulator LsrR (DeoR family)
MLDEIDLALVGIGTCDVDPPPRAGESYFTEEQLQEVRRQGAVGQVCLRFIDADGAPLDSPLDSLVLGITAAQLRLARRRWAAAGGPTKCAALRAALGGGWVDSLVTDAATAQFLMSQTKPPDAIIRTDGHGPLEATSFSAS